MAASIKDKFDYDVQLIKGHNGIFKITLNDKVIFDNGNDYTVRPTKNFILQEIQKLR
ncbi:MAG: Rdx family protein [Dehalococcoidia bacterium]|nr:MAG: Rdx family protein [Dehalococcoidia bacterium]